MVAAGVAGMVYQNFKEGQQIESYIPDNPDSFTVITIDQDSQQYGYLLNLGEKFGDREMIQKAILRLIFGENSADQLQIDINEMEDWVGASIGIGRINIEPAEKLMVMVVEVRNPDLAKNFLAKFEENFQKKGNAVVAEDFRDHRVVKIQGQEEVAYSLDGNFFVVSQGIDGVKRMIDANEGVEASLVDNNKYRKMKKNLEAEEGFAYGFFNSTELVSVLAESLKVSDVDLVRRLGMMDRIDLGVVLAAEEQGVIMRAQMGEAKAKNWFGSEEYEPKLISETAADLIFYLEGASGQKAIEKLLAGFEIYREDYESRLSGIKRMLEVQYAVNLDNDFFKKLKGPYALSVYEASKNEGIEASVIFEIDDSTDNKKLLVDFGQKIEGILGEFVKEGEVRFTTHEIGEEKYRYANLPDQYNFDLTYGVVGERFVVATGDDAVKKVMASQRGEGPTLAQSYKFDQSYKHFASQGLTDKVIYFDSPLLFRAIGDYAEVNFGDFNQAIRTLRGLCLGMEGGAEGTNFKGFLVVE